MIDLKSMWITSNQKKAGLTAIRSNLKILNYQSNQQNLICQYFFAPSLLG